MKKEEREITIKPGGVERAIAYEDARFYNAMGVSCGMSNESEDQMAMVELAIVSEELLRLSVDDVARNGLMGAMRENSDEIKVGNTSVLAKQTALIESIGELHTEGAEIPLCLTREKFEEIFIESRPVEKLAGLTAKVLEKLGYIPES